MADVSLILATYQRDKYLYPVLDSLLNQKDTSYEIIVVDQTKNRSPEERQRIDAYSSSPRIRWLNQDTPSPNKARNYGALSAQSDVLVFIDDDVIINDPFFLKKHRDCYSDPRVWAVCGAEIPEGQTLQYCSWIERLDTPIKQAIYFPRWHSEPMNAIVCSTCNFSIRKNKFTLLSGLDENFKGNGYCDDTDFGIRLWEAGGTILYNPRVALTHRFAVTGGCSITGKSSYPGWQQYVSPFIFAFRHLKGKERLSFVWHNALRKSIFLKLNVIRFWRWPKVLIDTIIAIHKAAGLASAPVASIFLGYKNSANPREKPDVLLSHSGKQHAYKQAFSLQKIGRLQRFFTSAYYDPARIPDKWFSRFKRLDAILRKRNQPGLSDRVKRFPLFELPEFAIRKLMGNSNLASLAVFCRDTLFDKYIARTQIRDCKIFWGFQGSCFESLKRSRERGITTVLELATAHVTSAIKILTEEKERNPEWADSISNLYFPNWYLKRLTSEPHVADVCVVSSQFSRSTLIDVGIDDKKIKILPLGADIQQFRYKERGLRGPFKILFVGGVGQRKGIKYLIDAYENIASNNIRLKIIGPIAGSGSAFFKRRHLFEYLGLLSQAEVLAHMHDSHVLVLPSLFEGFGLVIVEAMASGMPVIASPNSAGPDIIREGVDGFVVDPIDVNKLAERLSWLASNRDKVNEMGANASERAREYSWEKHSERLGELLKDIKSK